jgi:hypothetical protein
VPVWHTALHRATQRAYRLFLIPTPRLDDEAIVRTPRARYLEEYRELLRDVRSLPSVLARNICPRRWTLLPILWM